MRTVDPGPASICFADCDYLGRLTIKLTYLGLLWNPWIGLPNLFIHLSNLFVSLCAQSVRKKDVGQNREVHFNWYFEGSKHTNESTNASLRETNSRLLQRISKLEKHPLRLLKVSLLPPPHPCLFLFLWMSAAVFSLLPISLSTYFL